MDPQPHQPDLLDFYREADSGKPKPDQLGPHGGAGSNRKKPWSFARKVVKTLTAILLGMVLLIAGCVAMLALALSGLDLGLGCPPDEASGIALVAGEQATSCSLSIDTIPLQPCSAAEIVDPAAAAARQLGSNAGFHGVGYGCVPVCVWRNDGDMVVEADELRFYRRIPASVEVDRSGVVAPHRNYLFKTPKSVFGPAWHEVKVHFVSNNHAVAELEVRAHTADQACYLYGRHQGRHEWDRQPS